MIPTIIEVPRNPRRVWIKAFVPTVGGWTPPSDLDVLLGLSWLPEGLFVHLVVTDDTQSEQPGTENLWQGDSVELFLGTRVGESHYVQFLIGSYHAKVVEVDHRTQGKGPLQCRVTSQTDGGPPNTYVLRAYLGWAQLGIVPKTGLELAFQAVVNDRDRDGTVRQYGLHPGGSAYNDPKKMIRLRLTQEPDHALELATEADVSRFPQTKLALVGPFGLVGTPFVIRDRSGTLATGRFTKKPHGAVGEVQLSRAWDETITCEFSKRRSPLLLENPADIRAKLLTDAKLSFSSFVFTDSRFPTPEVSERLEAALGGVALTTTFYDTNQKPVTQPTAPGRYGAVTTLKSKSGLTRTFFTTLYKSPGSHDSWQKPNFFAGRIPEELGVLPEVSKLRQGEIAEFLRERFLAHLDDDPKSAVLLAGLAECKPDEPPVARLSPDARDGRWWWGLQQKLGLAPRLRTALQLPAGYDSDKTRRWPLLLFLHGSGESGDNLDLVKVHGPWKHTKEFLIAAPQNPSGDWWRPEQVLTLVEELERTYRLDTTRLYLTGLSLGGFGTWATALLAPRRFAAIAPICGAGDPADAVRLTELPVWAFHGLKDDTVPPRHSQEMIAALQKAGAREARLTLYPDTGHDAWSATYSNAALYTWLLSHRQSSL
ncbi:prolyl oligopeptidase family serine peptidase [Armatimonas rosea]|uniref:Putative esterase n=1 Tax=Armatimonas rosea TaxID=685828 RepID=A0A7W9SS73_ARMRO|nr:prolyl oligopeptidase family serine peptidase [Armatimonas rosea]MBB6051875.1 putative esterase [Armatimonas rosea]